MAEPASFPLCTGRRAPHDQELAWPKDQKGMFMSPDARNSLRLWIGVTVIFGLFWATLRFDLLPERSPGRPHPIFIILGAIILGKFAWNIWQSRSSRHDNADRT